MRMSGIFPQRGEGLPKVLQGFDKTMPTMSSRGAGYSVVLVRPVTPRMTSKSRNRPWGVGDIKIGLERESALLDTQLDSETGKPSKHVRTTHSSAVLQSSDQHGSSSQVKIASIAYLIKLGIIHFDPGKKNAGGALDSEARKTAFISRMHMKNVCSQRGGGLIIRMVAIR